MMKFTRVIPEREGLPLTDSACEEIKDQFKIDDNLDPNISLFNSISFQSWAHQVTDSFINPADGEQWNRYDGDDNGQGVYPFHRSSPMLTKDGYFKTSDAGLPYIAGTEPPVELAADSHRANENPALKAFHLMWIKIHNKRMAANSGDYDLSKEETIATMCLVTMRELEVITGMDFRTILDGMKLKGLNNSLEFVFAIARWAHAQMPDKINDRPIFEKRGSATVDMESLLIENSRVLNLGVSTAMQNMDHLPTKPFSILERTFARHNELRLPSFDDLATALRMKTEHDYPEGCPIWPGMLMEAEKLGTGTLGPIGARAVADGVAGSLLWGVDKGQGLWHPRWDGAPNTSADVVDYAYS